ncbi:hypothetical protein A6S26_15845 [Nostoc sp. ATCC 43529]|nr:hypothetical protein A6S26_15845 [Nostoc sp. ATCC 43529]
MKGFNISLRQRNFTQFLEQQVYYLNHELTLNVLATGKLFTLLSDVRDYQEINYPILWGGHLVRPKPWAGETPTPQEKLYVFLFGSPLALS